MMLTGVFSLVNGIEHQVLASTACVEGETQNGLDCDPAQTIIREMLDPDPGSLE